MNQHRILKQTLVLLNKDSNTLTAEKESLAPLNIMSHTVDYADLEATHPTIRQILAEHQLDFLLFAQNDQVANKTGIGTTIQGMRAGYSTYGAIDDEQNQEQTQQCLADFIDGRALLNLAPGQQLQSMWQPGQQTGFSFIFDTEQMAGVRYGLPRILDLLEKYQTPATFFVTGFVADMYADLIPTLHARGHSVAIHGRYHEYLSDMALPAQIQRLRTEREDFEKHNTTVKGANFLFRMNIDTIDALITAGYDYLVVSMEHVYFPFTYRKMPVQPFRLWTPKGSIWLVPVSTETYNRPLTAVRLTVNSALKQAKREQAAAINILMHPFRDGSLRHIGSLERLLKHLREQLSLTPTTIDHVINNLPQKKPSVYIYANLGNGEMIGYSGLSNDGLSDWQWHNFAKYWLRVGHLYTILKQSGHTPALCLTYPDDDQTPIFAIYPHLPDQVSTAVSIHLDPLSYQLNDKNFLALLQEHTNNKLTIFKPGSFGNNVKAICKTLHPQQFSDWVGIFPEIGTRLILKFSGDRHVF